MSKNARKQAREQAKEQERALEEKIRAQIEAENKAKAETEAKAKAEEKAKADASAPVAKNVSTSNSAPTAKSVPNADPAPTNATSKHTAAMTSEELAALIKQLADETSRLTTNHEQRITGCENGLAECKSRLSALEGGQPAPVAPIVQPKVDTPVAQPVEPAKTSPVTQNQVAGLGRNGAGKAYKYWRAESGGYGLTADIWAAKQASNGEYDIIWVWYRDDHIDHLLSEEEMQRYVPH